MADARLSEPIRLTVNGDLHVLDVDPETPLLYVLRNDLHLKATRFGCGTGHCGACKVLIDGKARRTCERPVGEVAGATITTLEGLAEGGALSALQQAFVDEQAGQCGYCLSGIVISAAELLHDTPHPSESRLRSALEDDLCRCGSHGRILRAIRRAAAALP